MAVRFGPPKIADTLKNQGAGRCRPPLSMTGYQLGPEAAGNSSVGLYRKSQEPEGRFRDHILLLLGDGYPWRH